MKPALRRLLPRRRFFVKELAFCRTTRIKPLPLRLDHVSVRWASAEDLPVLQSFEARGSEARGFFDQGLLCTIGYWQDEPASCAWFDVGDTHHSRANGFRFRLGPDSCWGTHLYVRPDYRLRGLFYKLWLDSMELLAGRGIGAVYHTINRKNSVAIRSHVRLGSEILFHYRVVRMLGLVHHSIRAAEGHRLEPTAGWGVWHGSDPFVQPQGNHG